jgi:hypothetical protein
MQAVARQTADLRDFARGIVAKQLSLTADAADVKIAQLGNEKVAALVDAGAAGHLATVRAILGANETRRR